jgi:hypothetical protein
MANPMNNKNILLSVGSYVVAFILIYFGVYATNAIDASSSFGNIARILLAVIFFAFMLVGIVFGYKSNKAKESAWAGSVIMLIGILVSLYVFLLYNGLGAL